MRTNMKGRDIPMEEKNNNTVYQLQPKLLVTNFNFDAMAATVTQSGTSSNSNSDTCAICIRE